jgi:hypothetical protein
MRKYLLVSMHTLLVNSAVPSLRKNVRFGVVKLVPLCVHASVNVELDAESDSTYASRNPRVIADAAVTLGPASAPRPTTRMARLFPDVGDDRKVRT